MAINASAQATRPPKALPAAGPQAAVCVSIVDLGTHYDNGWGKWKREIYLSFEFPGIMDEFTDSETGVKKMLPRVLGKKYTLSLSSKANLTKDLQAWRGKQFTDEELKEFDVCKVLGKSCMPNIEHYQSGSETKAGIGAIMALMAGMPPVTASKQPWEYSIDMGQAFPEPMPNWMRDIVMKSKEMGGASTEAIQTQGQQPNAAAYVASNPAPAGPSEASEAGPSDPYASDESVDEVPF